MDHYQHYLNSEFLEWTHGLTHAGYDRGLIIPGELGDDVRFLYEKNLSVNAALDQLEKIAAEKKIELQSPFLIE